MFQRFQRFMYGRYGGDKLNFVLVIFGLIITILGSFLWFPLTFLAYAVYFYAIFRIFSKNIPARQREYYKFLEIWTPIARKFSLLKRKFSERKLYKYFKCPNCKQNLRAPKSRGSIDVTCQRCGKQFRTKT